MTIFFRLFAWLLAAAVTFATLGPPEYRPHTNLGQDAEHALAFLSIGLAFALAYPKHRPFAAALSVVMIAVLEVLQFWAPGRHARLEDFVVDALAACAGFGIAAILGRLQRSRWRAKPF